MEPNRILIGLSSLFILGIGAQWLAWRLRVPSILLLLLTGFLAGPVMSSIRPEYALDPDQLLGELLFPVVSLSVALVLFEGALGLRLRELGDYKKALTRLLTFGAMITWALSTGFAWWLLQMPFPTALLLGAILTVTGPTVVGPLIQHIRPVGKIGPIARWEGIIIDPIGAVLALLVYEVHTALSSNDFTTAGLGAATSLIRTLAVGGMLGVVGALLLRKLLRAHWIPDALQSPVTLMLVILGFVISDQLQHESGLVTVTIMGVILANSRGISVKHILEFKENLAVLLISTLFILLASRLSLSEFTALGWRGPLFVVALILIVRPVSVFLSTVGTSLGHPEKLFLSWMAPRGIVAAAVSSIFALRLESEGAKLVPATFLVIVGTVVVYGLTAGRLARRLGLASANPQGLLIASAHAGARAMAHAVKNAGFPVLLVDTNHWEITQARLEGLTAEYANVLSDHVTEELDLGGIGKFLALTPNDEVNRLGAMHFSELFGRARVYRLASQRSDRGAGERQETSSQLQGGRILFREGLTREDLDQRFESGAVIKTTALSPEFNYEAFRGQHGDSAIVLFVLTEGKQLQVVTSESFTPPRPGQKLISLVDPTEQPAADAET